VASKQKQGGQIIYLFLRYPSYFIKDEYTVLNITVFDLAKDSIYVLPFVG
jgi:hypothetical protein